ncbi:threonyl-tRNA synthetase, partial [Spiromyces aspiralis]
MELAQDTANLSLNEKPQAQKRADTKKPAKADTKQAEVSHHPQFIDSRIRMFEELKKQYDNEVARKPREKIEITLPDGSVREGISWETTPMDIAKSISNSLAKRLVIAKVNDTLWDSIRPLEASCKLELLDFEHPEGKMVYWHSSAHVLGEACELHYGCHLCFGPPTESGFYYDMALPEGADHNVSQQDFPALESLAQKAIKEKQPFERLEMTKEQLLEMFKYNKYKTYFIQTKVPDGTTTTVYRCGPLIDL